MAVEKELSKLVNNLNKTNRQLVESRKALGKEAQKELATQISEQKTEFSSFLASRKMKKAELNFDKTKLEDAQRIHEANLKMQENAIKNDPALKSMKLEEDRIREELRLNEQSSNNAKKRERLNKELNENIKEQSSQRQTVEGKFSNVVNQSSENLESATKEYTDVLKEAGESQAFNKFTGGIKTLTGGLVDIAPIFDDVLKYANAIKDVTTSIIEFTGNLGGTFEGIDRVFGQDTTNEMRKGLQNGFKNLFSDMFTVLGAGLVRFSTVFGAFFSSVGLVFSTLLSGDAEMLGVVFKNMFKKFGDLVKFILSGFTKLILAPFQLLTRAVGFMVNSLLIPIVTGLTAILKTILTGVLLALRTAVVALVGAIAGLGAPFLIIAAAVALLGIAIILSWEYLKEKFYAFTDKMKEIGTKIGDFASNMGDKIMESFQKAIDKVKDLGGRLGRRILKFFGFGGDEEIDTSVKKEGEEYVPMTKEERMKYMENDYKVTGEGVGYNPEEGTVDMEALATGSFTKQMLQDLLDTDNLTDDSRSAIELEMRREKYNTDILTRLEASMEGLVWDKDSMTYMSAMDYAMRTPNTGGEIEDRTIELNEAEKQSGGNVNTLIKGGDTVSSSTTFIPPSGNPRNNEPSAARGAGG
jgi:hypothetical protein